MDWLLIQQTEGKNVFLLHNAKEIISPFDLFV